VATNSLSVVADAAIGGLTMGLDGADQSADTALGLQNRQTTTAAGTVTANLGDQPEFAITFGGAATSAELDVSGNQIFTRANANVADNLVDLSSMNNVTASGGLQSFQETAGAVEATTADNTASDDPLSFVAEAVSGVNTQITLNDNLVLTTGIGNDVFNTLAVAANTITAGGLIATAGGTAELDGGNATPGLTALADFAVSSQQRLLNSVTAEGFVDFTATSGTTAEGDTLSSQLSVSGNQQQVRALGSRADNALTLTATNNGVDADAAASGGLLSRQFGDANAEITATAEMGVTGTASMSASSLTFSGNTNAAEAILNSATNTLAASSTNLNRSTTAAAAPNANAQHTLNGTDDNNLLESTADFSLLNAQRGEAVVEARALTTIGNSDSALEQAGALPGQGVDNQILNSSARMSGNVSSARAVSSEALNSLSLDATNLGATGALVSEQTTTGNVTALNEAETNPATSLGSSVRFALGNTDPDTDLINQVAVDSTISVDGNLTTARASGNRVQNSLTATAGANYNDVAAAGAQGSIDTETGVRSANATYGVLNVQQNQGEVLARVSNATNDVRLTGTFVADTISGSTISVSGNQMLAEASGNVGRNTLAMTARPGGNGSAGLTSFQSNNANVTATMTGARIGAALDAGTSQVRSSTVSVNSNSAVARATGNSVVNRIIRSNGQ
jgi:hypothetical protein